MSRLIPTIVCGLLIWLLFRLNGKREGPTSIALWIPTFWIFITLSRNVSEWFFGARGEASLEGSPVDRAVLSIVLVVGLLVLLIRARRTGTILKSNLPIVLYFSFCFISVIWSDFPDVAFKRSFRGLGDLVMVLIILTDPDWTAALKQVLTSLGFVLVPVSILFNKYFPEYGRVFSHAGAPYWTGVTTEKNALGQISVIFALAFLFYFLQVYKKDKGYRKKGPLIALGAIILMSLYLIKGSDSATALACFFLAGGPMVLTFLFPWARKTAFVNFMVLGILAVACSALFLGVGTGMVEELGRNSTLTGRTNIWRSVLSLVQNPLIGTGYESFWLGQRYDRVWEMTGMQLNQAHNGYLEIFLNLGWIGIGLLAFVLVAAFRRIVAAVRYQMPVANLRLAYFMIAIAFNFTEACFKMMHPVWVFLLLSAMVLPEVAPAGQFPAPVFHRAKGLRQSKERAVRVAVPVGKHFAHGGHRKDPLRT